MNTASSLDSPTASQENYTNGIGAGVIAGILCAVAWAALTLFTGYQIGIIAIAVGFIIGKVMWNFGHGNSEQYGYIAAAIAILSILLGNILVLPAIVSREYSVSLMQALGVLRDLDLVKNFLIEGFSVIDLVFYGIAAAEAYRFSFRAE